MHIKLKISSNIWQGKHDSINIKLILFFLVLISLFFLSLCVGGEIFFTAQLYFSKSLLQNILQENTNETLDSFANQQNKTISSTHTTAGYCDLNIHQLIEKLNDAIPIHQRLTLFCLSSHGVEAAKALSKIGTPAVKPLTAALKDPRPMVRGNAVLALGMIKDNAAAKSMIVLLEDKDPIVRMKTAMALTSIKAPYATDALIRALNDDAAEVRAEAVKALARRKGHKIKKALRTALNDQNWFVRSEIEAVLQ